MSQCQRCKTELGDSPICHKCFLQIAKESRSRSSIACEEGDEAVVASLAVQFPTLQLKRLIGRGGMASIYHARQTSLDRDVAIKIIDRKISSQPEFLDRFEREAKTLAKLNHPNIVSVFDYGRTASGVVYLMMEYVHGLNLREAMESMPMDSSEIMHWMISIGRGLQFAHNKGVIHRDIKPENILLGDDGAIKIADFGIAKLLDSDLDKRITATKQVLGTLHYLAPEQLESPDLVDHRVDIYAMGVVFYELLTKQLPVGNFESPSAMNSSIDRSVDKIILKALHRRPDARYQTMSELVSDIEMSMSPSASSTLKGEAQTSNSELPKLEPIFQSPSLSVPFEKEDMGGLAQVIGNVRIMDAGLELEYRIKDAIFGQLKSKVHTLELPWRNITKIQFRPGVLRSALHIVVDSLALLKGFPSGESGTVEIRIQRKHQDLVQKLLQHLHARLPTSVFPSGMQQPASLTPNYILGTLVLFMAVLNSGFMAILQVIYANHLTDWFHVVCSVGTAVLLGPIIVMQLVSGILHITMGSKQMLWMGVVAGMIPFSPVALLGMIVCIATSIWVNQSERTPNGPLASQGLRATTMMFMRDSRNARTISFLETVGGVLFFFFLGIYFFGLYPTTLRFRMVEDVDKAQMEERIKSRLSAFSGVTVRVNENNRISIPCFQFQAAKISTELAIASAPKLSRIGNRSAEKVEAAENSPIAGDTIRFLPSLSFNQLLIPQEYRRSGGFGTELIVSDQRKLDPSMVATVTSSGDRYLDLEWSELGFRETRETYGVDDSLIGLEIDGWIEGIADRNSQRGRSIRFELSDQARHSIESIQSAVRGPDLGSRLELLP